MTDVNKRLLLLTGHKQQIKVTFHQGPTWGTNEFNILTHKAWVKRMTGGWVPQKQKLLRGVSPQQGW